MNKTIPCPSLGDNVKIALKCKALLNDTVDFHYVTGRTLSAQRTPGNSFAGIAASSTSINKIR